MIVENDKRATKVIKCCKRRNEVVYRLRYIKRKRYLCSEQKRKYEDKRLVKRTIVQDRCNCIALLHTVLHPLVRPNGVAHQHRSERRALGGPLRIGQDLPIWRPHDIGSRRREEVETKNKKKEDPLPTSPRGGELNKYN